MTLYDYQSVPTDADDVNARLADLKAAGFVIYAESGMGADARPSWHLRREQSGAEALEAVVGSRPAGALAAAGIADLEAAQATPDAALDAVPGVGEVTVEKVRRTRDKS